VEGAAVVKDRSRPFSRKHFRYWMTAAGGMVIIMVINIGLGFWLYGRPEATAAAACRDRRRSCRSTLRDARRLPDDVVRLGRAACGATSSDGGGVEQGAHARSVKPSDGFGRRRGSRAGEQAARHLGSEMTRTCRKPARALLGQIDGVADAPPDRPGRCPPPATPNTWPRRCLTGGRRGPGHRAGEAAVE
jgi:hypothetical protein